MVLKPQDLGLVLKLLLTRADDQSVRGLAIGTSLSVGETTAALQRARAVGLVVEMPSKPAKRSVGRPKRLLSANRQALEEFVIHGVRYVFSPDRGPIVRGVATAHGASPLRALIVSSEPLPVWPYARGTTRGESFSPLYRGAAAAAMQDPKFHELLSLVDAIRGGRARERKLAADLFRERIHDHS